MSGTLLAVIAVMAGLAALLRRKRPPEPEEPWRASLEEDDEPLDLDEIRRAEEEFLAGGDVDELEDDGESWRSH